MPSIQLHVLLLAFVLLSSCQQTSSLDPGLKEENEEEMYDYHGNRSANPRRHTDNNPSLDKEIQRKYGRNITTYKNGLLPLHEAIKDNDKDWVEKLSHHKDFDISKRTNFTNHWKDKSPLELANDGSMVDLLISLGAKNKSTSFLSSPLYRVNSLSKAKALVKNGTLLYNPFDVNLGFMPYDEKRTPQEVKEYLDDNIKQQLLKMEPNVIDKKKFWKTRLQIAAQYGYTDLVKKFVEEKKDDLNMQSKMLHRTAIQLAAKHNRLETFKVLLAANADPTIYHKEINSIWDIIAENGSDEAYEMAQLLLKSKFAPKLIEDLKQNTTAIEELKSSNDFFNTQSPHLLMQSKSAALMKLLYQHGAKGDVRAILRKAIELDDTTIVKDMLKNTKQAITSIEDWGYSISTRPKLGRGQKTLLIHHVHSLKMYNTLKKYMPKVGNKDYITWSLDKIKEKRLIHPIHIHTQEHNYEMVDYYLKKGTPPNIVCNSHGDPDGRALDFLIVTYQHSYVEGKPAQKAKFIKVAKRLLKAGGSPMFQRHVGPYNVLRRELL